MVPFSRLGTSRSHTKAPLLSTESFLATKYLEGLKSTENLPPKAEVKFFPSRLMFYPVRARRQPLTQPMREVFIVAFWSKE